MVILTSSLNTAQHDTPECLRLNCVYNVICWSALDSVDDKQTEGSKSMDVTLVWNYFQTPYTCISRLIVINIALRLQWGVESQYRKFHRETGPDIYVYLLSCLTTVLPTSVKLFLIYHCVQNYRDPFVYLFYRTRFPCTFNGNMFYFLPKCFGLDIH